MFFNSQKANITLKKNRASEVMCLLKQLTAQNAESNLFHVTTWKSFLGIDSHSNPTLNAVIDLLCFKFPSQSKNDPPSIHSLSTETPFIHCYI